MIDFIKNPLMWVLLFAIYFILKDDIEGFSVYSSCRNCGKLGERRCGDCPSCGWCVSDNGYGECVPGDANGPYFRQDCVDWQHMSNYKIHMSPYGEPIYPVYDPYNFSYWNPWTWRGNYRYHRRSPRRHYSGRRGRRSHSRKRNN